MVTRADDGREEILLGPGDFWFGNRNARVRTLLGSCVAITLWHPRLRVGGMCHFMVPGRSWATGGEVLDGRYAEDAMEMFHREAAAVGTDLRDYEVKLFGGGHQFTGADHPVHTDLPDRNVEAALDLVEEYRLTVTATGLGGSGPRYVILDVADGSVWVGRSSLDTMPATGARQRP